MIQRALGPLLSEEQLRSCLIAVFEAGRAGHGFAAADRCNSPKEWIKSFKCSKSPAMISCSKEDQKGQLMIDSRFSAQKQSQPIQLADYFYHLTQQVWRGAALFGHFTPVIAAKECRKISWDLPTPATRTSPLLSSAATAVVSGSSSPALPAVIWAHNSAPHA